MAMEIVSTCEQSSGKPETQMHSDASISSRKPKREAAQHQKSQPGPFKQLVGEAEKQPLKLPGDFISIDDSQSEEANKIGIQGQSDAGEYDGNQDATINTAVEKQCNGNPRKNKKFGGMKGGGGGKEKQQQESRRRLARGPRSVGATVAPETMQNMFLAPSEDHRVVSTEYQSWGTQVLMRVTLLAAGFVIGAKGNSVRSIGQATGAVVQSWTETNCGDPEAVPIRIFRIQGKKRLVQAAVNLIEQAVAKYRELCECKRRGEFVQREHVINGVEFYYQPPPKKALEQENLQKLSNSCEDIQPPQPPSPNLHYHTNIPHNSTNSDHNHHTISNANPNIPPGSNRHYPKYPNPGQYVHGDQKHNMMGLHIAHPLAFPRNGVWAMPQFHSAHHCCNAYNNAPYQRSDLNKNFKGPGGLFDWPGSNCHQEDQSISSQDMTSDIISKDSEVQLSDLNTNKLHQTAVDNQEEECSNENKVVDPWLLLVQQRYEQMSSSLSSFFGYGGFPVPVDPGQPQSKASEAISTYDPATRGFGFSSYGFLGGRFPAFSFASAINSKTHPTDTVLQGSEEQLTCALCIHQQAGLRFTDCKHCLCASCVEGDSKCPLCGKENQSVEQLDGERAAYHLWNCLPEV